MSHHHGGGQDNGALRQRVKRLWIAFFVFGFGFLVLGFTLDRAFLVPAGIAIVGLHLWIRFTRCRACRHLIFTYAELLLPLAMLAVPRQCPHCSAPIP